MNTLEGPIVLLKKGWSLFISNWKILVPIIILPSVISIVGSLLVMTRQGLFVILGGLIYICGAVASVSMMPAVINAVHRLYTEPGVAISVKDQYRFGLSMFWSVILVGIIAGLSSMGAMVLFIIPGIIVSVFISMYVYVLVIDGKKGFSALTESYSLIKGRWGQVFGRLFVIGIISAAGWLILLGVAHLFSYLTGASWYEMSAAGKVVSSTHGYIMSLIVNLFGGAIIAPVSIGAIYNVYISLKATRSVEVSTVAFKRWLVVFMCLGVLLPIIILISTVLVSLSKASQMRIEAAHRSSTSINFGPTN